MKGSEILVEALKRENVKVIFGIPGGAMLPFYDALYDSDITHILMRHEQGAAHAADGYARASGKVGVCVATSGPGASNLTTGIANAYMDSVPIVALTGQVPTIMIGRDAFQETDIIGITMPITKYNFQIRDTKDIPKIVKMAFKIATHGRPGPVLIDVPKDVQEKDVDITFPENINIRGLKEVPEPSLEKLKEVAKIIINAERPLLLVGGGVIISNASREVLELSEMLLIPVVTTLMGKGAFPEDHPLSLGMIGMHGRKAANLATYECDVLIAIGTRFSDRSTGNVKCFAPQAKIIHIDIDPSEIGKNVEPYIGIVGDARKVLRRLIEILKEYKKKENTEWYRKIQELKKEYPIKMDYDDIPIKPPRIMKELQEVISDDDIITTEVGQCQMIAAHFLTRKKPRTFITSGGLGTMGFGFPAAIGAKVARPNVNVIDIAGDGSFLMTMQQLATCVEYNINVVVAILNNNYLGMVRQWQELFYNKRYSAVYLGKSTDFVKIAEGFGAKGIRVERPSEIREAFIQAFKENSPVVIDFVIDPEYNILPMVPPGRCLKEYIDISKV